VIDSYRKNREDQRRWVVCHWPSDGFEFVYTQEGEWSSWVDQVASDVGVFDMVRDALDAWCVDEPEAKWLLQHGIAPGQSFCVRFSNPRDEEYHTDCGHEYDFKYDWELVEIEPWSTERALAAWETWIQVC
jgi:hypothetical protein